MSRADRSIAGALRNRLEPVVLLAAVVMLAIIALAPRLRAEEARLVPPPVAAAVAHEPGAKPEVAVLAGGCFWGVQGVFQHIKGVTRVESGYAGGARATAEYERVSDGDTGHAESVRIQFDPAQVSFGQLLQVYFSVAHDPTELNRQGPDTGTQIAGDLRAEPAAG